MISSGTFRHRIRIQRPVTDNSFDGAGSGGWIDVANVRANIQDQLPSRGEKLADGLNVATRPTRVRIRYRRDIEAKMRVLIGRWLKDGEGGRTWFTDRTAQIVSPPAELGFRAGLEFMVEDYSTAGNPA